MPQIVESEIVNIGAFSQSIPRLPEGIICNGEYAVIPLLKVIQNIQSLAI